MLLPTSLKRGEGRVDDSNTHTKMKYTEAILIDSHAHLDAKAFDSDRPEVIERAWQAGLGAVITVGVGENLAEIERALSLSDEHEMVFATVGVHPHDAQKIEHDWYGRIEELARHPKVVGIGETGLDYHYMHSPKSAQREAFERFLRMGRKVDLPVVIHTREADEDTFSVLREAREDGDQPLRGVVHCFSGDYPMARQVLDLGLHISFTGVITFPKADTLREVMKKIPLEKLLLETDCPYLAPVPFRGKRNEPARVVQVAETVATVVGRPIEEVARITTENVVRLFGLEGNDRLRQ
jgi:TatD DNase family protein